MEHTRIMRVLLVDDERLARAELRRMLASHPGVQIVGEAANADEAALAMTCWAHAGRPSTSVARSAAGAVTMALTMMPCNRYR